MDKYFYINDYRNAIFKGELPTVTVFPFKKYYYSPYHDYSFKMTLLENDEFILRQDIPNSVILLSESTGVDLQRLPLLVTSLFLSCYIQLKLSWYRNAYHIERIVNEFNSQVFWTNFKHVGKSIFPNEQLNEVQMLWIYVNDKRDKNEEYGQTFSMFDYLSAIVNPTVYLELKKSQNARENVSFDVMHEAIKTGNLEELDTIDKVD